MKTCPNGHNNHESYKFCIQCGAKIEAALKAGQLIQKRYSVERVLSSSGGFGITYLVQDQGMFGAQKVLKQLKDSRNDSKALQLFQREAKILSQLQHPQIPKLHAFFSDNNGYYLVQDYIEGHTLNHIVVNQGAISSEFALDILEQMLRILSYVHTIPLLHRDIKPANMIWGLDGKVHLIDFGAVKEIFQESPNNVSTVTSGGYSVERSSQTIIYTQGYAPPEQTMGKVYTQSDLYALGASLIELLTAQPLPSLYDAMERKFIWEAKAPSVSPQLIAILNHMTKEAVNERFKSAEEILQVLGKPFTNLGGQGSQTAQTAYNSTVVTQSTKREWLILPGQQSLITSISWDNSNRLGIGNQLGTFMVKEIPSGQEVANCNALNQALSYNTYLSRDNQVLLQTATQQAGLWQITKAKPQQLYTLSPPVDKISLSPDKTTIAGYKQDYLYAWSAQTGQLLNRLYQGSGLVITALDWRPDNQFVIVGTANGRLLLWEIMTEQLIANWSAHESSVKHVQWDDEGQTLLSIGGDRKVRQWEAYTNKHLMEMSLNEDAKLMDWNTQKKLLALITSSHQVEVWDLALKQLKDTLLANQGPIEALAWSPDGQCLAVGTQQLHLWKDL